MYNMNNNKLFCGIIYYGIGPVNPKIEMLLKNGGAQNKKFMVETVTHLICALNYTEEELVMNLDLYNVTAVTETWVMHSAKLKRLAETKAFDPSIPRLLRNVSATLINLSVTDKYRLYSILTFHGAQVTSTLGSSNTHLISGLGIVPSHFRSISHLFCKNISIISPDWVVDCIKENKLLPVQIYNPRLLLNSAYNENLLSNSSTVQKLYHFENSLTNINRTASEMDRCSLSILLGLDDSPGATGGNLLKFDSFNPQIHDPNAEQTIANIKFQLQSSLPVNRSDMFTISKLQSVSSISKMNEINATENLDLITKVPVNVNLTQCAPPQQILFVRPRQQQPIILQHKIIPANATPLNSKDNKQQKEIHNNDTTERSTNAPATPKHPQTSAEVLFHPTQSMQQPLQNTCTLSSISPQYQHQLHLPISPTTASVDSAVALEDGPITSNTDNSSSTYEPTLKTMQQQQQLEHNRPRTPTIAEHQLPISAVKTDELQTQENVLVAPQVNQPVFRQLHAVHHQPVHLQQQFKHCSNLSAQQQSLQRHFQQQQHIMLQQQQQLQQQNHQPHQSSVLSNQSPAVMSQESTLPTISQQGNMMLPQLPSCQQSPPSRISPQPIQTASMNTRHPTQSRHRQNPQDSLNQQQTTVMLSQQPLQHQQRLQLQSPQINKLLSPSIQKCPAVQIPSDNQIISAQEPIDPTDPVQVAQVLSRSTISPSHESLIMRQQQLKQQQPAVFQHHQSRQSPLQQQFEQSQSDLQLPIELSKIPPQMIINQGNQQVINQRNVINTSTSQGQQIIQNHLNQQPHQVVQQKLSSMVITTPATGLTQQQPQPGNLAIGGGSLRIIQQTIQQPQNTQPIMQQSHLLKNQQLATEINFKQATQQSSAQSIQMQHQQPQLIQQLPNKPRFIISQQQFNQLSLQQQQQILQQNQQNQNIFIVNQTNVNPQHISQSHHTLQNLAQNQTVDNNLIQQGTQKCSQIPNQTDSRIPSPSQNHQQQQLVTQSQIILSSQKQLQNAQETSSSAIQQVLINQQVINSPHRVHFLPQQSLKQQRNSAKLVSQTQAKPKILQQQIVQSSKQPESIGKTQSHPQNSAVGNNSSLTLQQGQIIIQQKQSSSFISNNQQQSSPQITAQQPQQNMLQQPLPHSSPTNSELIGNWQSQQSQIVGGPEQLQNVQISQNVMLLQKPQSHLQRNSQIICSGAPITSSWQGQPQISTSSQSSGQPQRQLIQLDDKTHAHFMSLDPIKKAEYIAKLHQSKQRVMMRPQIGYQSRPRAPNVIASSLGTIPRPVGQSTQHIIVQSQMPTGLTQQQQMQWLHQQGARQFIVRSSSTPGLTPIIQQQPTSQQQHQTLPQKFSCTDLNQQMLQKQHLRVQQIQIQQQTISPQQSPAATRQLLTASGGHLAEKQDSEPSTSTQITHEATSGSNITAEGVASASVHSLETNHNLPAVPQQSPQQMNLKTKTALANMLSNRLGNNGNAALIQQAQAPQPLEGKIEQLKVPKHSDIQQTQVVLSSVQSTQQLKTVQKRIQQQQKANSFQPQITEPSAACTLRLMTQQHNAALKQTSANGSSNLISNSGGNVIVRPPSDLLLLQQQELRRSISQESQHVSASTDQQSNVANCGVIFQQQQQRAAQQSSVTGTQPQISGMHILPTGTFLHSRSTNMPIPIRPQYYGHNPNLKLPQELFLVGCTFFVTEYKDTHPVELPLWLDTVRKFGGDIEKTYSSRVTHILCRTQRHGVVMQALRDAKRCITVYWLNDICAKKQLLPPWQPLHLPFPSTFGNQKPLEKYLITADGFEVEEYQRIRQMIEECGGIYTSYLSKHHTVLISKNLEGEKLKAGKEWNIPAVNVLWLNDICVGNFSQLTQFECPKYQQYNLNAVFRIDYSLVPHLLAAWKSPINLTQEAHERVKQSLSVMFAEPSAKKPRSTYISEEVSEKNNCAEYPYNPGNQPKILFSQVVNIAVLKKITTVLGGIVVNDPAAATHLVMTRVNRTCKLIQAACHVNYIVKSAWLIESAKYGKFLPVENFRVQYIVVDENMKFDLTPILNSPTRSFLFEGIFFFVTPDVFPDFIDVVRMIESSGGKVEAKRRTAHAIADATMLNPESYIIVTCPNDMFLCVDLTRLGAPMCPIVSTEFVMSSILNQKLDISSNIIPYLYNKNIGYSKNNNK